ncbi:MAG: septal ring lytic transglycosylase RlpA family protein [Melioribacteraceae bacterium]|nr:septal ring lytic transglycosylase RlpA family protein [Melioribacteraceae bacterium]
MKTKINHILIILIAFLFWSCGSSPRFTSNDPHPPKKNTKTPTKEFSKNTEKENDYTEFHNVSILEVQTGIASFYAEDFHGNLTANGEIFDMYGISAAHPTYPSGTVVRVTNLANNKSEILRINDHMPQHPERIIDLSYGAAQKLDMIDDGIAEVKVDVLKWGDGKYKK